MFSSDTDNDIIISSALLIASTLYQVNKSCGYVNKQTADQSQLGDSDRLRNFNHNNRDGF